MSLLVLPQHPVAISRCQVFAVWTHTDGPDARPALCCLPVSRFIRVRIGRTLWIQQCARVPIYVDYIQQILHSNDRQRHLYLLKCIFVLTGGLAASECETYAAEDVLRVCPTVRAPQSDGVISRAAEERSRRQTSTQIPRNIWEHLWRDERKKVLSWVGVEGIYLG